MKNDKNEYLSVNIKDEIFQSPVSNKNNDDVTGNHDAKRTNENSD
jgi:hypothetical protein